jgi:Vitamin K-dependent gamma-carboxylase
MASGSMNPRKKQRSKRALSPAATAAASNRWERYWFGSVAAVRPYLLMKAFLFMLAFDMWMVRLRGGWRFGLDAFNVAHFRWLDAVQPLPTAALYNGLVLLVGILAFVCAVAGANLLARVVLALAYTYTWAQSMLDGYQHHYFISLILIAFIFFPPLTARRLYQEQSQQRSASNPEIQRVSAWAYVLVAANISIVYAFTALAKADGQTWNLVRGLLSQRKIIIIETVEAWFVGFGLSAQAPWVLAVQGIIALEIILAAAYLLTVRQDEKPRRWLRIAAWCAIVLALCFHGVGNEFLVALHIGLFSYYMIVFAFIYFLPESILYEIGRFATWPARRFGEISLNLRAAQRSLSAKIRITVTTIGALFIALLAARIGFTLDLPGASTAGLVIAIVLVSVSLIALGLRRCEEIERYVLAAGLATVMMWIAVAHSTVRTDYYRMLTDHNESKGNHEAAKRFETKAKLYASKDWWYSSVGK